MCRVISFVFLLLLACFGHAAHNVTAEDTDSSVVYAGIWSFTSPDYSGFDHGATHHYSNITIDPKANASFTFIGTAIYFWSPKWPYPVTTVIRLDNADTSELLDLQDYSSLARNAAPTVKSQIVWGKTGLKNTTHQLVVSRHPTGMWVILDALTYTVLDPGDAADVANTLPSAATSTNPTPTNAANTSGTTTPSHASFSFVSVVAPAVIGALIALGLMALPAYLLVRHLRRRAGLESTSVITLPTSMDSGGSGGGHAIIVPFTATSDFCTDERLTKGKRSFSLDDASRNSAWMGAQARESQERAAVSAPPHIALRIPSSGSVWNPPSNNHYIRTSFVVDNIPFDITYAGSQSTSPRTITTSLPAHGPLRISCTADDDSCVSSDYHSASISRDSAGNGPTGDQKDQGKDLTYPPPAYTSI